MKQEKSALVIRREESNTREAGTPRTAARKAADGHDPGAGNVGTAGRVRSKGREGVACGRAEPQTEMKKPNVEVRGASRLHGEASLSTAGLCSTVEAEK